MNTYLVTLFALLSAPPDAPAPAVPAELLPHVRAVALALELTDPREVVMVDPAWYAAGLETFRRRWADFRDAPGLAELCRLPDRDTARANWQFALKYREHLRGHQPLFSWDQGRYCEACRAADWHVEFWGHMDDAANPLEFVIRRRSHLAQARDMLEPADWYGGWWPPPAPLQYFRWDR